VIGGFLITFGLSLPALFACAASPILIAGGAILAMRRLPAMRSARNAARAKRSSEAPA
jgi:hypothetical protein